MNPTDGRIIAQAVDSVEGARSVIRDHLNLRNLVFQCRDVSDTHSLSVPISSTSGTPATDSQLKLLQQMAKVEYKSLEPLYREFNGLRFHQHGNTAGLVVASTDEFQELNDEWREWFYDLKTDDLFDFQRDGIAFATIEGSGNFFVIYKGKIYYSDHDGGDDTILCDSIEDFFHKALANPPKFLYEVGCYTRYFDGKSKNQFIPENFSHD